MAKLPFFKFYPLDWFRDTSVLSNEAKGIWVTILAYAWNEPKRGVYERTQLGFCRELGIDPKNLENVLEELRCVGEVSVTRHAPVTPSNGKITVMSRKMMKYDSERFHSRIRQRNHRHNAPVTPLSRESNAADVRSQKSDPLLLKPLSPKANDAPIQAQAPASPKGPMPRPSPALNPEPEPNWKEAEKFFAQAKQKLAPRTQLVPTQGDQAQKQIAAQDIEAQLKAKLLARRNGQAQ